MVRKILEKQVMSVWNGFI